MLSRVTPIVLVAMLCGTLMTEATAADVDRENEENAGSVGGEREDRRRPKILGAPECTEVNGPDIIEAATFATAELTKRSNGSYRVIHQQITKATSGIVSGHMYRMTLEVIVTSSDNYKSDTARCSVKVWDQAWRTPRYTLEEYSCDGVIA